MYRTSAKVPLICPACRAELGRDDAWPEGTWGCHECRGLWLEAATARHAVVKLDSALVSLAESLDGGADRRQTSTTEPRRCCRCNDPLSARVATGARVQIDVCERHGTWFDAREVAWIAHFARAERQREQEEIGDFVRSVEISEEGSWGMFCQWLVKQLR
jgi:Zn-finger nucleic acid-binding protein